MATGEQKWSSRGQKVKTFDTDPIPKGVYQFELLADNMEAKLAKDELNSIPRIGVRFVAQGTAKEEGQKDRLYFHDFHLSLKPGKDTIPMPNRGGQLIEFARSQGDELDDIDLEEKTITDPADGVKKTVKYLNPVQVMEYLESKAGTVTEGKLGIDQDSAQSDDPAAGLKKGDKYPISEAHPGRNKMNAWKVDEANLQQEEEPEAEEAPKPAPKAAAGKKTLPSKGKK